MRLPRPLADEYEATSTRLGSGSFSSVIKAMHKPTSSAVAIKVIDKSRLLTLEARNMPQREIDMLRRMGRHQHAVFLIKSCEDADHVYLVLELAERGSLLDVICSHPFGVPLPQVQRIRRELLRAVAYVHSLGHVHLDVAPGNVLLGADGQVKLADFGWSNFLISNSNDVRDTFCGTLDYLAPEMLTENHM